MSHNISGKIHKAPFTKEGCGPEGNSKMYSVELSEMIKDYRSGEKTYTNLSQFLFFAKTDAAKSFYDQAFQEGSFVVIDCDKLKIEQREHNGVNYVTLMGENCRLSGAQYSQSSPAPQQQAPRPPAQQPAPQMAPPQQAPRPTPTHAPQTTIC